MKVNILPLILQVSVLFNFRVEGQSEKFCGQTSDCTTGSNDYEGGCCADYKTKIEPADYSEQKRICIIKIQKDFMESKTSGIERTEKSYYEFVAYQWDAPGG